MLTFDNMKSGSFISNKSIKVSTSEVLFGASVEQGQLKVKTVKPALKLLPVLLNINQEAIRFDLLRLRDNFLGLFESWYGHVLDNAFFPNPLKFGLFPLFLLQFL
jgi:hypothetical protein